MSVIKDKSVLNNATKGRKKVTNIKDTLVPTIVKNISKRFEWMEKEEIYDAFKIFDVNEWLDGVDTENLIKFDNSRLEVLAIRFEKPLNNYEFDLKEAKKEWQKVQSYFFLVC